MSLFLLMCKLTFFYAVCLIETSQKINCLFFHPLRSYDCNNPQHQYLDNKIPSLKYNYPSTKAKSSLSRIYCRENNERNWLVPPNGREAVIIP